MLMTLPITIPSASPSSEGPIPPRTSPSTMSRPDQTTQVLQSPQQAQNHANTNNALAATNNTTNVKRKPNQRAERRALHNTIERQRRETLNSRFLDLAALLPNLSQVRRPSKSSIVNSSIAHIHASCRYRLIAAHELRLLKLESDALRREVNEWRNRAGISILEEPVRSEAFSVVMSGELEAITGVQVEEDDDDMAHGGFNREDDGYTVAPQTSAAGLNYLADARVAIPNNFPHEAPAQQTHYTRGNGLYLAHAMSHSAVQGPMITSPTAIAFENHISRTPESNINDETEDVQNHWSLTGYRHHRDGYRHVPHLHDSPYTTYNLSRLDHKDTHIAYPCRESATSSIPSPSQSDSDSQLGVNSAMSTRKRRRISADSAPEPSSSPTSLGSFDNLSNMSSVTSYVRSFVDYPCSNYSSCNRGSPFPNAQFSTSRNLSNSNGMAKTFSNWSDLPSFMAANENRSRPGSAQSGSSGGRSDSP